MCVLHVAYWLFPRDDDILLAMWHDDCSASCTQFCGGARYSQQHCAVPHSCTFAVFGRGALNLPQKALLLALVLFCMIYKLNRVGVHPHLAPGGVCDLSPSRPCNSTSSLKKSKTKKLAIATH